jgi:CSLREA domain-containing protein
MTMKTHTPALAAAASAVIAWSGLALTPSPAHAASTLVAAGAHHASPSTPLSRAELARVRERQREMVGQHRPAPTFAKAASTTFKVDTTEDSPLATPGDTQCVDAASSACSLRAAVEAANNLHKRVTIVLGRHTYTLSSAAVLSVTNPKGTSVVGQGAGKTSVAGAGSGLFSVSSDDLDPATLFLSSLRLRDGEADYGGAVSLEDQQGGTLVLDHVRATGNSAAFQGGAIFTNYNSTVYISDSRFSGNHASTGAALYQSKADVSIENTTFTGNSTTAGETGYGGAVFNDYGVFRMSGGSITGNTAGSGEFRGLGGGLYDEYATTSLTDVHIDGNTASGDAVASGTGGGIYAYQDELEIRGGTISSNRALGSVGGSGGGIYSPQQSQLSLRGVTMKGNKAEGTNEGTGGGTLFMFAEDYPSQLVMEGGRITGSDHSAVYLYGQNAGVDASFSNATFARNTDSQHNGADGLGCGGALCVYGFVNGGMNLELDGNTFSGNTSVGDRGAGAVSVYTFDHSTASVKLHDNEFSENHTGAAGYGGAVGAIATTTSAPISVRMSKNTFSKNHAGSQAVSGVGGAFAAYDYVTVRDTGSRFSHNRAFGNGAFGGGVAMYSTFMSSSWTKSRFTGNSAGNNVGTNEGFGGAVYSSNTDGDAFTQVTMDGNTAASAGGGYYGDGDAGQTSFQASTLSNNTAGTSGHEGTGGGLFADNSVIVVANSTLTGNKAASISGASGQGGAIWGGGYRLAVRYSTVSGNYAKVAAGIYSNIYSSVLSSIVSENKTSRSGSERDCGRSDPAYELKSLGGNVLGQKSCVTTTQSSDKVAKNPHLGSLKDNGGPTRTMALSKKSPAVGRASYLIPGTDQRGHDRPGNHADAGAYELPRVKKKQH